MLPGSPAAQAGIRVGDEITQVDAASIRASQQLIAEIGKRQPGSQVELGIRRGGEEKTFRATLASPEALQSAAQNRRIQDLERQVSLLSAQISRLTGNQRENWPAYQGNGDNSWYYQIQPGSPRGGIYDYGARAETANSGPTGWLVLATAGRIAGTISGCWPRQAVVSMSATWSGGAGVQHSPESDTGCPSPGFP